MSHSARELILQLFQTNHLGHFERESLVELQLDQLRDFLG